MFYPYINGDRKRLSHAERGVDTTRFEVVLIYGTLDVLIVL